jgi:hypothetical protein
LLKDKARKEELQKNLDSLRETFKTTQEDIILCTPLIQILDHGVDRGENKVNFDARKDPLKWEKEVMKCVMAILGREQSWDEA